MPKHTSINGSDTKTAVKPAATTTTNLPGLQGIQVIVSKPALIKENSSKVTKK